MKTSDITNELKSGTQFGNEAANWYTINRPQENFFMLVLNDKNYFFHSITKYAKRVARLMKTGH